MAGTAVRTAKKTSAGLGYYALAGVLGCLAAVFLSIAAYAQLQAIYDAPIAASIVGGGLALLSAAVGIAGTVAMKRKQMIRRPSLDGNFMDTVEQGVKHFLDGLEEPVRDNPKAAMLMAALAGFAAGDKLGDKIH